MDRRGRRSPAAPATALLAALLALGAWPWLGGLRWQPIAPDSAIWVLRGAPVDPDWWRWDFARAHFGIAWRPVTAFSFTVDHALGGFAPLAYRLTDLVAHLSAAAFLFALAITLTGGARRDSHDPRGRSTGLAGPALAAGLLLAHPAAETVVPYLARRSYSLAASFGLAALLVLARSAQPDPPGRGPARDGRIGPGAALAAAVLSTASILSHEVGVLFAGAAPLLVWAVRAGRPGLLRALGLALAPSAVLWTAALWIRHVLVGGVGGYELGPGETVTGRFASIFAGSLRALVPLGAGTAPAAVAALVLGGLLAAAWWGPHRRLAAAAAAWLGAGALLFASQGVLFHRQTYVLVPPLGLLAAAAFSGAGGARAPAAIRVARAAPVAVLLLLVLAASPLVRGPDRERTARWGEHHRRLERVHATLAALEGPARVHLVQPYREAPGESDELRGREARRPVPRKARVPAKWWSGRLRGRDVELVEALYYEVPPGSAGDLPLLEGGPPPAVLVPEGRSYFVLRGERFAPRAADAPRRVPCFALDPDRRDWAYVDGETSGRLVSLEP